MIHLKPETISRSSTDVEERAQWRFDFEDENTWRNSGESIGHLAPGTYTIITKQIPGWTEPAPSEVIITANQMREKQISSLVVEKRSDDDEYGLVTVGDIAVANDRPFVLFGGMNVLESRDMAMQVAEPDTTRELPTLLI